MHLSVLAALLLLSAVVEPIPGPGPQDTDSGSNTNCKNSRKHKEYCLSIEPGMCKRPEVYKMCCATCRKLETNVQGCRFGDENVKYCAAREKWHCYDEVTRAKCCNTCKGFRRNTTVCEYGDHAPWCSPEWCKDTRRRILRTCCESCPKKKGR